MGTICPCPRRTKYRQSSVESLTQTLQIDYQIDNRIEYSQTVAPHKDGQNYMINDNSSFMGSIQTPIQGPKDIYTSIKHYENQKQSNFSKAQVQITDDKKNTFNSHILKSKIIKKRYNPQDYRFANQKNSFLVKSINSIKQQQFNIQNCQNSTLFLFDITANVYIDDCDSCFIFIAPCQSTVFIRNCKRLTIVVATKQFRTYQCHDCIFSLYCKTQPVIESSSSLKFRSFQSPVYAQLSQQFQKAHFQPWNNHWSQIHNFTEIRGQKHYQLQNSVDFTHIDWNRAFLEAGLTLSSTQNYIPIIKGDLQSSTKAQVLILVHKQKSDQQIKQAIKDVILLKAFQGVLAGQDMTQRKVLFLDILNFMPESFESIGIVYTSPSQIEILKSKWLISFAVSKNNGP